MENPEIEKIKGETKKLDYLIEIRRPFGLIKIDIEGAELGLLGGAVNLTKTDKPLLLFECGLGASDYYGVMLGEIFQFFETELSYNIFTFVAYLKGIKPLISRGFVETYESKSGYYFVAVSKG